MTKPDGGGAPAFSVVIPARDAAAVIARTLDGLARQEGAPSFEVIVVDDGSTDATPRLAARAGVRVLSRPPRGPAAARNEGVRAARGERIALLGADTVPDTGWLAAHAAAHAGRSGPTAFVGHIDWHEDVAVTPFLRFVNERGPQFGFGLIPDPRDVAPHFFYSSNASLQRELLVRHRFDERFTSAAWEDVELGMRMHESGIRLAYLPGAAVRHLHAIDLPAFLERQRRVGAAALTFRHVRPGAAPFLRLPRSGPPSAAPAWLLALLTRLGAAIDARGIDARPLWWFLCRACYRRGARTAWKAARRRGRR